MRQRQSSVTCATQLPVKSIGADSRADRGGCLGGPGGCAAADSASASGAKPIDARNQRNETMDDLEARRGCRRESYRRRGAGLKSHLRMAAIASRDFRSAPTYGFLSHARAPRAPQEPIVTRLLSALATVTLLALETAHAQPPPPAPPSPEAAARAAPVVERARAAAGTEWQPAVEFFCGDSGRANRADDPLLTPTRVFDNLYAIGRTSTVIWALTTPAGILLIDAGYPDQVEQVLLPGLTAVGLNPADVKYVLVAHGHSDHFGGASYFQQRGARVALSAADWDLVEKPPAGPPGAPPAPAGLPPPRRDVVVADGQPIAFGGVEITPVLIPGHTPGSLGFVFAVKDGAATHTAALFGGSILLSGRIPDDGLRQYAQSVERFATVTKRLGADVEIQNHPLYDGFDAKLARLAQRRAGDPHPFVVGADSYQRFLTVMKECANAQLARR
jgi:metallo-beta-lactamase class B